MKRDGIEFVVIWAHVRLADQAERDRVHASSRAKAREHPKLANVGSMIAVKPDGAEAVVKLVHERDPSPLLADFDVLKTWTEKDDRADLMALVNSWGTDDPAEIGRRR